MYIIDDFLNLSVCAYSTLYSSFVLVFILCIFALFGNMCFVLGFLTHFIAKFKQSCFLLSIHFSSCFLLSIKYQDIFSTDIKYQDIFATDIKYHDIFSTDISKQQKWEISNTQIHGIPVAGKTGHVHDS